MITAVLNMDSRSSTLQVYGPLFAIYLSFFLVLCSSIYYIILSTFYIVVSL